MREYSHAFPIIPLPPLMSRTGRIPLNVVLFGPPGAGKGTQADRFAARHGVPKISTGDMLRTAIQQGTDVGRLVKDTLRAGALVGDDLIIRIVRERLEQPDTADGFVLDGFPRTVAQAKALDAIMALRGPLAVIALTVNDEVLVQRLSGRGRSDDTDAVIRERLAIYERKTAPVIDYYSHLRMISLLDGDRAPELVSAAIEAVVARAAGPHQIV